MKDFFNLLSWKNVLVAFLAMLLIRISIVLPFYNQWLYPCNISWSDFLMFAFGICFLLAGNNIATKYFDEKLKIISQNNDKFFNIKDYPDINRLKSLWIVTWFVGLVAVIWASIEIKTNYLYPISAFLIIILGYFYAVKARRNFLIGNISLACIYSIVVLSQFPNDLDILVPFSYKFPNYSAISYEELILLFVFLTLQTFILTLLWDITGDVTNTNDDIKRNFSTIGAKIGEKNSKKLLYVLATIFIAIIGTFLYYYNKELGNIYILITAIITIIPIIYYVFMLNIAKKQTDYNYLYAFLGMIFISLLFVISFCKYIFNGNI